MASVSEFGLSSCGIQVGAHLSAVDDNLCTQGPIQGCESFFIRVCLTFCFYHFVFIFVSIVKQVTLLTFCPVHFL